MTRSMKVGIGTPGLSLPLEAVTATIVAYGGKGMGKTNLGSVLVEELSRNGLRWAWLDPLGVSWGLRHSADGSGPGVQCLILGGPKGDVPIEPDGGAAVADVVIEEPHNVLIDFSRKPSGEMWSVGERVRFVTAYALRLFQRQGELVDGRRREPLFQMLDEAARYIPQVIPSGAPELARCVGAWEQLCEEGRNIGLGVGLLTQRSARMNKSVSELADAMFAFRTVGPNSLGAVLDWLGQHVEKAHIKDLADQVRALERGHALVVSPGWLRFEGVVQIRMRETFDSSATPKAGERQRKVRGEGARPDLDAIRTRMSATIEKAKADDPKALRAQIAALQRQLAEKRVSPVPADPDPKALEQSEALGHERGQAEGYARGLRAMHPFMERLTTLHGAVTDHLAGFHDDLLKVTRDAPKAPSAVQRAVPRPPAPAPREALKRPPAGPIAASEGGAALRRVMIALAQNPEGLSGRKLSILADVKRGGSTWRAAMAALRRDQHVDDNGEYFKLTAAGVQALGAYQPLPTGAALREHWRSKMGNATRLAVFDAIVTAHPKSISQDDVAQQACVELGGSTWRAHMAYLRGLELVSGRDQLRASDELFDD